MSDRLSEIEARLSAWERTEEAGDPDRTAYQRLNMHAAADLDALAKFAREVEALHQPRTVYANESHCALQGDHAMGRHVEDRTGFWVCLDSPLTDECQTCTDDNGATADWPCPTAAAVQRLGGAS